MKYEGFSMVCSSCNSPDILTSSTGNIYLNEQNVYKPSLLTFCWNCMHKEEIKPEGNRVDISDIPPDAEIKFSI